MSDKGTTPDNTPLQLAAMDWPWKAEDPGIHILYNVSLTMPDDVYQQAPDQFEALADTLLAPLDEETMAELNRLVSSEGEDPVDVARNFLTEQGLIGG